jgi:NAD(P)-dependent dehydrogenase (short-subunit alcohol dehydrogenase family)
MVSADRAGSRTFVVTGAASGIGLATAAQTSAQGPRWCTGNRQRDPSLDGPCSHVYRAR